MSMTEARAALAALPNSTRFNCRNLPFPMLSHSQSISKFSLSFQFLPIASMLIYRAVDKTETISVELAKGVHSWGFPPSCVDSGWLHQLPTHLPIFPPSLSCANRLLKGASLLKPCFVEERQAFYNNSLEIEKKKKKKKKAKRKEKKKSENHEF